MNLRSFRIFGLAVFDYVVTFIGAFFLHYYMWIYANGNFEFKQNKTSFQYYFSLIYIFFGLLVLGTILHYFFNIKSTFSKYLGFND